MSGLKWRGCGEGDICDQQQTHEHLQDPLWRMSTFITRVLRKRKLHGLKIELVNVLFRENEWFPEQDVVSLHLQRAELTAIELRRTALQLTFGQRHRGLNG